MIFTALQPSPVSPSLPFLMILGEEEKGKKKKKLIKNNSSMFDSTSY